MAIGDLFGWFNSGNIVDTIGFVIVIILFYYDVEE